MAVRKAETGRYWLERETAVVPVVRLDDNVNSPRSSLPRAVMLGARGGLMVSVGFYGESPP